LQHGRLSAFA